MKKWVLLLTAVVFLAGLVACGGESDGKYADAKTVIRDMIDTFDKLGDEIGDADDGKSIATAIETFVDKMKGLREKMEEMEEKYPELKGSDVPEDFKDLMKELTVASNKLRLVIQKAQKFATEPDVMNAIGKLAQLQ